MKNNWITKFLTFFVFIFFWTNNLLAKEDLYCLDIGQYGDFATAYKTIKKNSSYTCDDFAKELNDNSLIKKFDDFITINKKFYDNAPFVKGSYPKTIKKEIYREIKSKYGLENTFSKKEKNTCAAYLDWSWYLDDDLVTLNFLNKDNKPMQISGVAFYTENSKYIMTKDLDIYIKPFGKFSRNFKLIDLNTEIIKTAALYCDLLKKEKKNVSSSNNSSSKFENNNFNSLTVVGILIALAFIAYVGYTWYDAQNPNRNKRDVRVSVDTSSRNQNQNLNQSLVSKVWNGDETMSKTFWVYCILLGAVVGFSSGVLSELYGNYLYIPAAIYIFWSNIGLWNSSTKYKFSKLKQSKPYGWAIAAKVYVVFNFLTTLSQAGFIMSGKF